MNKRRNIFCVTIVLIALGIIFIICCVHAKGKEIANHNLKDSMDKYVGTINYVAEKTQVEDWTNLVFESNGKTYTWPLSYEQLVEDGYYIIENEHFLISDNPLENTYFMGHKDDSNFVVLVEFKGSETCVDLADSYVQRLNFFNMPMKYSMELGNGIGLGTSYDTMIEVMGKPGVESGIEGGRCDYYARYETDDGLRIIEFTFDNKIIEEIEIRNLEEVES